MKKVALFWFLGILAIGILMSCSDDSSGTPRGQGSTEYEYCVYKDNELCLLGPFDKCSSNGKLNNSCPKNYNEIEPPPAGTLYEYCVYSSSEVCLSGPFDTCIGGEPGSTCPYESKITPPTPPSPSSSSGTGTGGGQSSSSLDPEDDYGDPCGDYCNWGAGGGGCKEIRTDPDGSHSGGTKLATCAKAKTNCDYNGVGRYGNSTCSGSNLSIGNKPQSCSYDRWSNTYCKWVTGCYEIKTDPAGLYGSIVSTCPAALSGCASGGVSAPEIYTDSGCNYSVVYYGFN